MTSNIFNINGNCIESEIVSGKSVAIAPGNMMVIRLLLANSYFRRPTVIARTAKKNAVPN
ncbi:hypothetical protein [Alkalihalobacillus sp. TS-13]|uniref:hypothetical protein n=1 Tax=Alkalihalobacillus sp. TS-13 TaxID=2842455 RepID=UPI001C8815A3|nr:hypothetical protein [Alkalihalobacillus sp. TS-13]